MNKEELSKYVEKEYQRQIDEIESVINLFHQNNRTLGHLELEDQARIATQLVLDSYANERFEQEQGNLGYMYGANQNG